MVLLLVAALAIGYVHIQMIQRHVFDSISVWMATVSGGLSVNVST